MRQIGDILLTRELLLDIGRVIPNLKFDSIERRAFIFLKSGDNLLGEFLRLFLSDLCVEVELACLRIQNGLGNVGGQWLCDRVPKLPALVDDHLYDDIKISHE